jgi:hypothetical protein
MDLYFSPRVSKYWEQIGNWFTNNAATIPAAALPAKGDHAHLATGATRSPQILSATIDLGNTNGICDIPALWNNGGTIQSGNFTGAGLTNGTTILSAIISGPNFVQGGILLGTLIDGDDWVIVHGPNGTGSYYNDTGIWTGTGGTNAGTIIGGIYTRYFDNTSAPGTISAGTWLESGQFEWNGLLITASTDTNPGLPDIITAPPPYLISTAAPTAIAAAILTADAATVENSAGPRSLCAALLAQAHADRTTTPGYLTVYKSDGSIFHAYAITTLNTAEPITSLQA